MTTAPGRKALVTGGASGFGLATARRLADAGAAVVIADVSRAALDRAVAEDPRLTPLAMDVANAESVHAGVAAAAATAGGLDTVVLCAGVIHIKPLAEVTERDWDVTLDVNLKGAFLCAQAAAPWLVASGRGRMVLISSDAGRRGFPGIQAYCASKWGLIGLCESLAAELARDRVTVNCVCPSACPETSMGEHVIATKVERTGKSATDILASVSAGFPLGRPIEVGDVVSMILYFISEEAASMTAAVVDIDGGTRLPAAVPGV